MEINLGQPFCKEPIFDFFLGSPVFAGESHQAWCPAHFVNP